MNHDCAQDRIQNSLAKKKPPTKKKKKKKTKPWIWIWAATTAINILFAVWV